MLKFLNCIATYFVSLCVFYLLTRIYGFAQFVEFKDEYMTDAHQRWSATVHYMQLIHSICLVIISSLVIRLARQRTLFRQREYTRIIKLTLLSSILYVLGAFYIGWITVDQDSGILMLMEWVLMSSVSARSGGVPWALSLCIHIQIEAVLFGLHLISSLLSEHIKVLNRIRSGGRSEYNALELNKLISDVV